MKYVQGVVQGDKPSEAPTLACQPRSRPRAGQALNLAWYRAGRYQSIYPFIQYLSLSSLNNLLRLLVYINEF